MVSPDPNIGNKFCKRINAALIKIIHARINKRKIFKNWIHPNDEIDVSCIKNQSLGGRREVEKQLSKVNVVSFILMWLVVWLTRFIRMVGRQPRLFPQTELWPPDPTEFTTVHWLWCEAVRQEDSGWLLDSWLGWKGLERHQHGGVWVQQTLYGVCSSIFHHVYF